MHNEPSQDVDRLPHGDGTVKGQERETPPLVATDLDGTLLDYATRRVPEGFDEVLGRVLAAGAAFAVASGRTPHGIRTLFPRFADRLWLVCDNGARLCRGAELVEFRAIPGDLWTAYARAGLAVPDTDVVIVGRDACFAPPWTESDRAFLETVYHPLLVSSDPVAAAAGTPVCKVLVRLRRGAPDALDTLRARFGSALSLSGAEPGWLDAMAPGVDKGSGVRALQRILGADPARCVCFGDWENDVPMLRACGRSYAMRGGHPAALAAARFVAPPCAEGGVAAVLRTLFPARDA